MQGGGNFLLLSTGEATLDTLGSLIEERDVDIVPPNLQVAAGFPGTVLCYACVSVAMLCGQTLLLFTAAP